MPESTPDLQNSEALLSTSLPSQKEILYTRRTSSISDTSSEGFSSAEEESGPLYTLNEVKEHCDAESCWIVLFDKVYDVTNYLSEHPGGEDIILENAGFDATRAFQSKGHSKQALHLLQKFYIGCLVQSERVSHFMNKSSYWSW